LIFSRQIELEGFAIASAVAKPSHIQDLIGLTEASAETEAGRGGVRNLLDLPAFRALANSAALHDIAASILGEGAFVVRGILFDKTDAANWKVPWHQDVTIAVTERRETPGYSPWSVKSGVTHVQPPAEILEQTISLRLHLDDCPAANGALRVLPGTHRFGKLDQKSIDDFATKLATNTCEANAGDVLLMRPLLVHASSASSLPKHRRVIHFDYANVELANALKWRERRPVENESTAR